MVKLSECRKVYTRIGYTGVYRLFLLADGQIVVHSDGVRGNGSEVASIRLDASDLEELGKREAAREIQRRFEEE